MRGSLRFCTTIATIWMCLFVHLAQSGTELTPGQFPLDQDLKKLILDDNLLYLPDPNHRYDADDILDGPVTLPWRHPNGPSDQTIKAGGLYWFKATLSNNSDQGLRLLLQTKYPAINVADLYQINPDGSVTTIYADAGLEDKFSNRPIPHRNLINAVVIPPEGTITLVWRIDCEPLLQFSASLWEPMAFGEWDLTVQLIHGLLYGMLLVMTVYNLFLYFSTGEKSYFYYVAYVATILYMIAAQQGHIYQYIAPDEVWAKLSIYTIVYSLNSLMFAQFTIHFLNLRKRAPRLMQAIRIVAVVAAALPTAVVTTSSLTLVFLIVLVVAALYLLALWAGITVRRQGVISAGHYIIAIMVLALALITSNMAALGLIESNELIEQFNAIGATLMLVFFSMALADRINQLQKDIGDANKTISHATEEKQRAEAELRKLKEQRIRLEQASSQARRESRSKSNFLATLSHEIRTPMNGILGMTELMKATKLDDQQTYYLNAVEHSGQSLLSIINDLQDFARIEAGQLELEIASFNLETLIDDCIATFALRAIEKNINFIADIDPSIDPVLKGDASKLQQIILNLLSNAFKFTDHGDIILVVRATSKQSVNSVELKFEVHDSGIGLTEEEQQRLFTPFQHADDSTYGRYGGSGIGLAISKQLAELMDGQIGVISESGKGSCFWFTARLLVDEHPDPGLIRQKSTALSNKRLLLVDSNTSSADIITRLLTSWQMNVECVSTIDDALQALTKIPFDIILSEYHLDNGDGVALAKRIRDSGTFGGSFVLMAASRHLKNQRELSQAGVDLLLEKPITTALLHDVLQRAFDVGTKSDLTKPQTNSPGINADTRVLVVEDNQVNQMVIIALLEQLGIQADCAENGLAALSMYDKHEYDVILMDCDMPEMDGYEATSQIRAREQREGKPRTVVIALSAHARSDYQQRAAQAGMDGYLTKPVTLSDLRAAMVEHLSTAASQE